MESVTALAQWIVRAAGALLVVVGAVIWTGRDEFVQAHVVIGAILVVGLWLLALRGQQVGASSGLVLTAGLWGFLLPAFGLVQEQLLTGDLHWLVEVLHLIVGVVAIGLGEALASGITKARRRSFYR